VIPSHKGFAYDIEDAEIGVGCIGVLIHNRAGDSITFVMYENTQF
jgi:DNA-binding IclR family transcriptional regulator